MTSALGGGGGPQKADEQNITRGEREGGIGVQKSIDYADVI